MGDKKALQKKLKESKMNDERVLNYLSQKLNETTVDFIKMQLTNCQRSKHGRRYTAEQKSYWLASYKQGPKSYRFNERSFILPGRRTLGRHSANILFQSGTDSKVFEAMKDTVKDWSEADRQCVISWDEVALEQHLDYCPGRDFIEGFVEMDKERRPKFATHSLTFQVRGITWPYKQSIGYFYTNGLSAIELVELVKIMIGAVLDTGNEQSQVSFEIPRFVSS